MADNIDITINETVENIDVVVNPNLIEVNITRINGASIDGLVPYTGATDDVNLGSFNLTANNVNVDAVNFDLNPIVPTSVGSLYWDNTNKTLSLVDGVGATTLQIGQEERVLVKNTTGSTLTDGQIVYITGATGNLPSVSLASALNENTSAATLGMVTETITNGSSGFVTITGLVNGLNTLSFNEGDIVWLSNTAGEFTNIKPTSPSHLVLIGYVTKKSAQGSIYVKIQNTQELNECSDVFFGTLSNNDLLIYESATGLWKNKQLSTLLGGASSDFVKGDGSLDSTTYATQSALNTEITNRISGDAATLASANNYTNAGLATKQAALNGTGFVKINGTTISYDNGTYYPNSNPNGYTSNLGTVTSVGTSAPLTGGTITGTGTIGITQANTTTNGYLSSTDWNTFNSKQAALGFTPENVANKATNLGTVNNTLYPTTQAIGEGTAYKRTIAQIRSLSGTLPNNNFYTTDLGQEGNWYYDASDSATPDNTGTVLVTADGKRIKRITGKEILAKWFGLISDGSTDNQSALQQAINTGSSSNLPIVIPSGNYLLSSSLNVSTVSKDIFSRIEIRGEDNTVLKQGFNGILLNLSGSDEGTGNSGYVTVSVSGINFNNAGYSTATAISVSGVKTVIFDKLYIYGGYQNGISLKSTYANSKITNVRINGCTNAGIISLGQVNNIRYENCAFLGCNYGFYASPLSGSGMISGELDTNTFSKCDFEVNTKSIFIDSPQPFQNLAIVDNHFESNTGDEITINNYTSLGASIDISGLTISGNLFSGAKGVQIGNSNSGGFLDAVSFNNNRFATNTPDTNSIRIGSECPDKNRNVLIFNNNYYADGSSTSLEKLTQAKLSSLNNVGGVSSLQPMYKVTPESPSSSADTKGIQGDLRYSDNFLIFKTATGWKKSILNSFDVTGTNGYLPKYTPTGVLADSQFYDNGTNVGIGTNSLGTDKFLIRTSGSDINGINIYSPSTTNGATLFLSDNVNGVKIKSLPETTSSSLGFYTDNILRLKIEKSTGDAVFGYNISATSYTGGATLTGTPTAPTATAGTNTTQIATTAFVNNGLATKQNTLTNPVTGTGTTNYLPKLTGTSTLGNSLIYDNGTHIGIGTSTVNYGGFGRALTVQAGSGYAALEVYGSATTQGGQFDIGAGGVRYASFLGEYESTDNGRLVFRTRRAGVITEAAKFTASGSFLVGTTSDNGTSKLQVNGSVKVANDTATASSSNVGAIRYRSDANNSYCEQVMQTGASSYSWVIIKQNTW